MRKGTILRQFKNSRIYKDLYGKPCKRDWMACTCKEPILVRDLHPPLNICIFDQDLLRELASSRSADVCFSAFARNHNLTVVGYLTFFISHKVCCRVGKQLECTQGLHRVYKVDAALSVNIYSNFRAYYSF